MAVWAQGEELCHSATLQMGTRPEGRRSAPWGLWGRARIRRLPCPPPAPPLSIFGHISFRSDWELVKVDFRPSFSRPCGEEDYSSWDLTNLQVGAGRPTSAWGPCPGGHGSPSSPPPSPGSPPRTDLLGVSGPFSARELLWAHSQGTQGPRLQPSHAPRSRMIRVVGMLHGRMCCM